MTTPDPHEPKPRSIQQEIEVPGTPEQVWEAIATGPGISCWFVPARVDEREGGAVAYDRMGSGMEDSGVVTAWDPPRRFVGEEQWQAPGTDAPVRFATEFLVEARAGGTCIVRIVSSVFASGDAWDDQLESTREGGDLFLRNLRLYLTHFPGQRGSWIMATGNASGPLDAAWAALTGALGLSDAAERERAAVGAPGVPPLAGVVEWTAGGEGNRVLTLRLDQPAPGYANVHLFAYGGQVHTHVHAYLFGAEASAVAARDQPRWRTWMQQHFPTAEAPSEPSEATTR